MVKPLSFKGDKKVKKRKRNDPADSQALATTPSSSTAAAARVDVDEDDGWTNSDHTDDISGPVIFVFVHTPFSLLPHHLPK